MTRKRFLPLLGSLAIAGLVLGACGPDGNLDAATVGVTVNGNAVTVAGWSYDRDVPTQSIDVHVYIDAIGVATTANLERPDVAQVLPQAGPFHGFSVTVNVAAGTHQVCAYGINAPGTPGDNTLLGCRTIRVTTATTTTAPTTSTTTPGGPPTTVPAEPSWTAEMLSTVNATRTQAGLSSLTSCSTLSSAAQSYSATLAAATWLDSTGPDGSQPWTRTAAYDGTAVGEDISFGFTSPAATVSSALASDEGTPNIYAPEFEHIGLGRSLIDPDGTGPQAPGYIVVQVFGAGGSCQ
jgi:uncharacterized protein YkwD